MHHEALDKNEVGVTQVVDEVADVAIILRAWLAIHTIDSGNGHILVSSCNVLADDLFSMDSLVPYPEPKPMVELHCKPYIRTPWGQVPCCVSFLVLKLRVGSTRHEQQTIVMVAIHGSDV